MNWKTTLIASRFYVRNPVRLPSYTSSELTPAAQRLLLDFYALELVKMGSPGRLMRWGIILPAWFIATLRTSFRDYRKNCPAIRRDFPQLRSMTILWRMAISVFANNFPSWEFFRYKLYLTEPYRQRRHYLPAWQLDPLLTDARPGRKPPPMGNKYGFWQIMSRGNIPVPPVLAFVRNGEWIEGSWAQLEAGAQDIVLKPVYLSQGRNIAFLDANPAGGWLLDGRPLTNDEARAHTEELSHRDELVVQPRLNNHPVFAELGIEGVITVRIVTIKTRRMAEPVGLFASLRIPNQTDRIPDVKHGALICGVDWETGIAKPAYGIAPGHDHLDVHPQTGAILAGLRVPCWEACKTLCLAAHKVEPDINSMGWDAVVTPDGPLLLEANPRWAGFSAQVGGNLPLLQTKFPELYEEWPLEQT